MPIIKEEDYGTTKDLQRDIQMGISLDGRNDQPLRTTQLVPTLRFQSNCQEQLYITTTTIKISIYIMNT